MLINGIKLPLGNNLYELKSFENGFKYLEIKNKKASAKIALQGAHIFHYQKENEDPLLWLSEVSEFEYSKAIRGGIPLCWPRFGSDDKDLPQHGFARTFMFELVEVKDINLDCTHVHLRLKDSKKSKQIWDKKFQLDFIVHISDTLSMELITTNLDNKNFEITQAFHTYFNVSNIKNISIFGLENKHYLDALDMKIKLQENTIEFENEVDRVYQGVDKEIILHDKQRDICIKNKDSKSVIVWNPWIKKCLAMSAMKADAYKEFVCIESANAFEDKRLIKANTSQSLVCVIS
jgi:glucose-6-phosphate 1-epimerase